jgi:uncharacterized protein YjdB
MVGRFVRAFALAGLTLMLASCCGQFFKGEKDVTAVSISPSGNTIQVGNTQQFSATGSFQYYDGSTGDVTGRTTWTSSDPDIATIDSTGLATAIAFGTVTIKGSCECYTSKATLTVGTQTITLTSIEVTPSAKTILSGNTQQFTATAQYSNSTSADISSSATWKSSDPSVATIDARGMATASSAGTATITASSGGISGTTTLSVLTNPSPNP